MIKKICPQCKKEFNSLSNRAKFCGKPCFYLSHRKNKTKKQKSKEKAEYDKQYREKNKLILKDKKAKWFQETYDPAKAAAKRSSQEYKDYRNNYMGKYMTPEKKEEKAKYDQERLTKIKYGDFWEAGIALTELQKFVRTQVSGYESRKQRGILNKTLERSRHENIKRGYS